MAKLSGLLDREATVLAAGLSLIVANAAAFYIIVKNHRKGRKWTGKTSSNDRIVQGPGVLSWGVPAERYPYIPTQGDHGADMTWSSPAVERYGRDGRRRLVSAACFRDETTWELSESDAADPRCRALSSRDVLLCVLSFLDRKDTLSCGRISVVLNQTATDDTIWANYVKQDVAKLLWRQHLSTSRERPSGFAPPFFLQAGLGRVIDMVYAQLPRAYNDLYPRLPPTREQPAPRKARKSWHRLHLTMSWVRYLQRYTGGKDTTSAALGRARLTLERKSRAIISLYGVNTLFPEQILSFVSFLFWACCADYWDELVVKSRHGEEGEEETTFEDRFVSTPAWADMLSMLKGYLRLYQGRKFIVLKGNMGFLLHDPAGMENTGKTSDKTSGSHRSDEMLSNRELRIPCSHNVFVENLESLVPALRAWPYSKQITMDVFISEFSRAERSRQ